MNKVEKDLNSPFYEVLANSCDIDGSDIVCGIKDNKRVDLKEPLKLTITLLENMSVRLTVKDNRNGMFDEY